MQNKLRNYLILPTLALLACWAIAVFPTLTTAPPGFWEGRKMLIILTGILALAWMSSLMLMALRPLWLERRLGGLDKLYRLHKWYGIGTGLLILVHWLAEMLPKKMVGWGWLKRTGRGGPKPPDFWLDLAKDLGEWAGYLLMALVVLALIKRIPYHWFRKIHKSLGLVFLMGAYHGLMLLPKDMLNQPIGWITIACAIAGSMAALLSLFGLIGRKQRYAARLISVQTHSNGALEVCCDTQGETTQGETAPGETKQTMGKQTGTGWPGHQAGQFLLVTFDKGEGSHPFTIASAWNTETRRLTLIIKPLGDYTHTLAEKLHPGQALWLEGPYGNFTFGNFTPTENGEQVWVAGGVGITPFLARLEELARKGGSPSPIHFFYSLRNTAEQVIPPEQLPRLCKAAGVTLHCRYTEQQGAQPADAIAAQVKAGSSVWFCGPAGWGKALEAHLRQQGLAPERFHREFFEFR